jgi:hypothetical protein
VVIVHLVVFIAAFLHHHGTVIVVTVHCKPDGVQSRTHRDYCGQVMLAKTIGLFVVDDYTD